MSRQNILSSQQPARAGPGRPPVLTSEERKLRILEAAERVFIRIGYGAASMEAIACTAGMSKKSVYALFADKRAVFAELISHVDTEAGVNQGLQEVKTREDLLKQLRSIGEFVVAHRQVELTRLVISEAKQCPELAEEFYKRIIQNADRSLTDAIRSFSKRHDDVAELLSALIGNLHLRALLGAKPLSRKAVATQIEDAVELLLPSARKRGE